MVVAHQTRPDQQPAGPQKPQSKDTQNATLEPLGPSCGFGSSLSVPSVTARATNRMSRLNCKFAVSWCLSLSVFWLPTATQSIPEHPRASRWRSTRNRPAQAQAPPGTPVVPLSRLVRGWPELGCGQSCVVSVNLLAMFGYFRAGLPPGQGVDPLFSLADADAALCE